MNYLISLLLLALSAQVFAESTSCLKWPSWFQPACKRLNSIWNEGNNDLYLSGYAWHNRYTYSPEKIKSFNENAWGGGLGKSIYDDKGNWHSLYAIAFMDSHNHVEPLAGYAYVKYFPLSSNTKIGLGATAFITSRVDIYHNIPFPGVLPVVALTYKQVSISANYIPGSRGAGNVLFVMAKYSFKNS